MNSETQPATPEDEMLPEYDFRGGVRGKYAKRIPREAVMVVLDPGVAEYFPDSDSVNRTLRAVSAIIQDRSKRIPPKRACK